MSFTQPHFQDIVMDNGTIKCHIWLAKYGGRFKEAQIWFDKTLVSRMHPYIPYKTGEFLGRIISRNAERYGTGELVVSVPPQGRRLYPGYSLAGRPFNWTNPQTKPRWGTYTYKLYKNELTRGVTDILLGRRKGGY